jgi:hypothetical protein
MTVAAINKREVKMEMVLGDNHMPAYMRQGQGVER